MNEFFSLSIVVFAAVIHATMQLASGGLLLLYHASFGAHTRTKTKALVGHYISGFMASVFLCLMTTCFVISKLFLSVEIARYLCVLAVLLFLAGVLVWLIYYRHNYSTELWLPRPISRYISTRARLTKNNVEAFSLGGFTNLAEFPFTLSLLLASAYCILALPQAFQFLAIALYIIISVLPLIIIREFIRTGKNLAEIQRLRNKNKTFLRIFAGLSFFVLAAVIISFGVWGNL